MNAQQVWRTIYGKPLSAVKYKFKVGDQVKISKHKRTFEKSYLPNWSKETFAVVERLARDPPVYKLKEHDGELIKGTFYETELQKVIERKDHLFRVEKVLRCRGKGAQEEVLVHWKGWPKKYDSWIPVRQLVSPKLIQDNDFYVTLPSNASTNLFPSNSKSHYRVALPRQIHLKEEEDWEVGLHSVIYPSSWFDISRECIHSHIMLRNSDDFKLYTLPEGMYRTALELMEGILQCLKEIDPLPRSKVEVDNECNVTLNSYDEWIAITVSVAQALGWLTSEKTVSPGVQMNTSLTTTYKHGYEWCVILPQTSINFPGNFIIPSFISLCPCKLNIVQVLTNPGKWETNAYLFYMKWFRVDSFEKQY